MNRKILDLDKSCVWLSKSALSKRLATRLEPRIFLNFFFFFKKKEAQEFITLYDLGSGMQLINQWILDSPKI